MKQPGRVTGILIMGIHQKTEEIQIMRGAKAQTVRALKSEKEVSEGKGLLVSSKSSASLNSSVSSSKRKEGRQQEAVP